MKYLVSFVMVLFIGLNQLSAQREEIEIGSGYLFSQSYNSSGKVVVVQDARLRKLMEKDIEKHKALGGMTGYRVQIYLSSEPRKARQEAEDIKMKFDKKFPEIKSYLKYETPFFKVQAGDFRSQHEALKFIKSLQVEFPNSYIVKTDIEFPNLDY